MTSPLRRACAPVLLAALAACGHAPARTPLPDVAWPPAPAAPRARLAGVFPDPAAPSPPRPFWARVLDAIAGTGGSRRPETWLARPFAVAARADGTWFVADPDAPAVIRVGAAGDAERLSCRGREWQAPMALALAPDGALWVADSGAAVLVRVGADGRCTELGRGALERPTGIAVAPDRVVVADPARHEVVILAPGGAVLKRLGGLGAGVGQLHFPTAVALRPSGELLVVDALNFRIARFAADGAWAGAFGEAGGAGGAFERPKGVAVDGAGRILVTDAQRDLILVYSADGAFEAALGASGAAPGELTMPAGLAVAGRRLYVADSLNRRVQVFDLLGDAP